MEEDYHYYQVSGDEKYQVYDTRKKVQVLLGIRYTYTISKTGGYDGLPVLSGTGTNKTSRHYNWVPGLTITTINNTINTRDHNYTRHTNTFSIKHVQVLPILHCTGCSLNIVFFFEDFKIFRVIDLDRV